MEPRRAALWNRGGLPYGTAVGCPMEPRCDIFRTARHAKHWHGNIYIEDLIIWLVAYIDFYFRRDPITSPVASRPVPLRPGRVPVHNSDRQQDLLRTTFPLLTQFWAVLTPFRCDFRAQVAPTSAPGPAITLEKPRFSLGFSHISKKYNFSYKVA